MASQIWLPSLFCLLGSAYAWNPYVGDYSYPPVPDVCNTSEGINYGPMAMLNHKLDTSVYDKYARPNTQLSPTTGVSTDADHLQIMLELKGVQRIDPILQTVEISVKAYTQWFDDRVAYDISSEDPCIIGSLSPGGRTRALLEPKDYKPGSAKRIWTPEPYIINKVDETIIKELVYVYQTGLISLFEIKAVKFACDMDFSQYPFDKQECFVKMRDFAHAASEIVIDPGIERFKIYDLFFFSDSLPSSAGTFHIIQKTKTEVKVVDNVQTVFGYLYFERSQSTFWGGIFLVDLLLNLAIWVSFWIPKHIAPARIALIIISFLAFRIVMAQIYAGLPPVTYPIWVIDYMSYSQFFAVISLLQYGYLCYYMHKEKALELFLKTVSTSKLPQYLDQDGWEIDQLCEECKKIRDSVAQIVKKEEKKRTSIPSPSTALQADAVVAGRRGTSLDRVAEKDPEQENGYSLKKTVDIEEALIICRAVSVFNEAAGADEFVDIIELKQILRRFGKYYSKQEVCCVVEKFKLDHNSSLKMDPLLSKVEFLRLLVDLNKYAPRELPALKKLYDMSPTHIIDVQTRKAYPVVYLVRTFGMLLLISTYTQGE